MLIRAMAEAGMIGGIADWFAVEALFRHPLGLPIPHTALLPKNQKRAARNVGRFFDAYFLDPDQVGKRVAELQPARRAAGWLSDREHARLVARYLAEALGLILSRQSAPRLAATIRREMRGIVGSETVTSALSRAIAPALREGLRGPVVTDILQAVRNSMDENREGIAEMIQDRSRWWLPAGVDRRLSNLLIDGVLGILDTLAREDSPSRGEFERVLAHMIDRLAEGGALERAVARGKESLLHSEGFETLLRDLTGMAQKRLQSEFGDDPDRVAGMIAEALQRFARQMLEDPETLAAFEARLTDGARSALTDLREPISGYVTDVIQNWDPKTLSDRFETEIGPDLQFIRINGAVLGALIGGLLFAAGHLLGA